MLFSKPQGYWEGNNFIFPQAPAPTQTPTLLPTTEPEAIPSLLTPHIPSPYEYQQADPGTDGNPTGPNLDAVDTLAQANAFNNMSPMAKQGIALALPGGAAAMSLANLGAQKAFAETMGVNFGWGNGLSSLFGGNPMGKISHNFGTMAPSDADAVANVIAAEQRANEFASAAGAGFGAPSSTPSVNGFGGEGAAGGDPGFSDPSGGQL